MLTSVKRSKRRSRCADPLGASDYCHPELAGRCILRENDEDY